MQNKRSNLIGEFFNFCNKWNKGVERDRKVV